jgi:hypothetical protein
LTRHTYIIFDANRDSDRIVIIFRHDQIIVKTDEGIGFGIDSASARLYRPNQIRRLEFAGFDQINDLMSA